MPENVAGTQHGLLFGSLVAMRDAGKPWADVQRHFRRHSDACTDGGYFECLMLLWKAYGRPGRSRFFRSAFSARTWNPMLIMNANEYNEFTRMPDEIRLVSTGGPAANPSIEFRRATPDELSSGSISVPKRHVFAVQIADQLTTYLVLDRIPTAYSDERPALPSQSATCRRAPG